MSDGEEQLDQSLQEPDRCLNRWRQALVAVRQEFQPGVGQCDGFVDSPLNHLLGYPIRIEMAGLVPEPIENAHVLLLRSESLDQTPVGPLLLACAWSSLEVRPALLKTPD
jgi:hypothetical protein